MPEKFGFDEVSGNRAAVYRDQWLFRTRACGVDRFGDDFLTDARFAFDQHWHTSTGCFGSNRERSAEFGGRPNNLVEAERRGEFFRQRAQFTRACTFGHRRFERAEQAVGGNRLYKEIRSPGAHRLDRNRD